MNSTHPLDACNGAALAPHRSPLRSGIRPPRMSRGLAVALLLCAPVPALHAQDEGATIGSKAPVVSVPDLAGTSVRLGSFPGRRPALIEFWATWCDVCKELLPRVRAAHAAYGDRVDFYGVNVTVNESRSRVERYVTRERPPWVTLFDERGVAVRAFKAPATSYVVIVDRTGTIRYAGSGGTQDLSAELAKVTAP
ncbi:MAG: TlpA disulfide reductase family protein [Gemmatimonadota bacterium]